MAQDPSRLPELNLGVIGHHGHGKTTLTAALLKQAAARFGRVGEDTALVLNSNLSPLERVRSYQFHSSARRYGHLDIPGGRGRIRVTSRALSQLDAALLVVDATRAVGAQTREHLVMARGVGVPNIVVFLNRCDEVTDPTWLDEVEREVRVVLVESGYPGDEVPFVRGSALRAYEGVAAWAPSIDRLIDVIDQDLRDPARDDELPPRMFVEEVVFTQTSGWVCLGRIDQGVLRTEKMSLLGMRSTESPVIVRSIERYHERVAEARAGSFVGVSFDKLEGAIPLTGQVLVKPETARAVRGFVGSIRVIPLREWGRHTSVKSGHRGYLHTGTSGITCSLTLPQGVETVAPGDEVTGVTFALEKPVWTEPGRGFVMRDGTDGFRQVKFPKPVWNGRRNVNGGEPMMAGTAIVGTITALLP